MTNLDECIFIGNGKTAEVYAIGDNKVVKLYYPDYRLDLLTYERDILTAINEAGTPSPKLFGQMEINGRQGLIFEHINAQPSLAIIKSQPWKTKRYAVLLAQLHFQIHQTTSADLEDLDGKLMRSLTYFNEEIAGRVNKINKHINSLPKGNTVCHGAFHPKNLLHSKDRTVAIDWMYAHSGHYMSDIAITLLHFLKPEEKENLSFLQKRFFNSFRKIMYTNYLKEYTSLDKNHLAGIERWYPAVAPLFLEKNNIKRNKWVLEIIDRHLP